jgi:hypothetical protein
LSGHWLGSIDALLIYATTLLSGFVAALLYRQHVFLTGFCAGAIGAVAYGLIKLLAGLHAGWIELIGLPLGYALDMIFAALASGMLGAAGAASAVVAYQYRSAGRSGVRS